MRRSGWVDFEQAKAVPFERVLEELGLTARLHRVGNGYKGACPLCSKEGEKDNFGIDLQGGVFNCFRCKRSGKVMEFVAAYVFKAQHRSQYVKEAAQWLVELATKGKKATNGSKQTEQANALGTTINMDVGIDNGAYKAEENEERLPKLSEAATKQRFVLTEREEWLAGVIAHACAFAIGHVVKNVSKKAITERGVESSDGSSPRR